MKTGVKLTWSVTQFALDTFEQAFKEREPVTFKNIENMAVGFDTEEVRIFFIKKNDELPNWSELIRNL